MSDTATNVERNRERHADFDIAWRWADDHASGLTAVMRVKNEAHNLPWVLPGLFRSVRRVVLIDNESTDGTGDVAKHVADEHGASERLEVLSYPFAVSRCGSEHLHTPADSVHSLTYFYNWSFSHVGTRYALKWDGDMVLTDEGEQIIRDLAWQLEATDVVLPIPRVPAYIASRDVAYLDFGIDHHEPCGWPNTAEYRFAKGFEWEVPIRPDSTPIQVLPKNICFELKWLDADEFSNWTATDFITSERSGRKQRDWVLFNELSAGRVLPGLARVDRGDADHVIEVIRQGRRSHWERVAKRATR